MKMVNQIGYALSTTQFFRAEFFAPKYVFPCEFQLTQLVKSLIVEYEICRSISVYTKNQLMSWFDDKEFSLKADIID